MTRSSIRSPADPGTAAVRPKLHADDSTNERIVDALEALTLFGASALRAGGTAARTRELMELLAPKLGFDAIAISLSIDSITTNAHQAGEWSTRVQTVGPPGINTWRIARMEQFVHNAGPNVATLELVAALRDVESTAPLYSRMQVVVAIGLASGSFAFLNGVGVPEILAAALGGGAGQMLRSSLSHRQLNQYAVVALSAMASSGTYVGMATLAKWFGFEVVNYSIGCFASVLFLIPGFPLIAALFDLLQHQTVAAISRFAYGLMLLLAVAFGLCFVIQVTGVQISQRAAVVDLPNGTKQILLGAGSLVAACGFAIAFNNPWRAVLAAGFLALIANSTRLALIDAGMMPAPAAFLAALLIGLLASLLSRRLDLPTVAIASAPVVIMIPGLHAFQMIVLLNQGRAPEALQSAAVLGFVVGALATGLSAARLLVARLRKS